MIVIEDSHNGNDTIVVGHWCNNGCTTFHLDDLNKICKKHFVSEFDKQELLRALKTHDPEKEDWELLSQDEDNLAVIELLLKNGKVFEKFARSPSWEIRREVARTGHYLELLSKDVSSDVRCEVANQGQFLDAFLNDPYWYIRMVTAEKGHRLDHFINDIDPDVREAVAHQRYGLDILKNDTDPCVRWEVAYQGYALDELVNDPVEWVQRKAREMLAKQA